MAKDYTEWHYFKSKLDSVHKTPTFKEREIWWCSIGLNIGDEEDGKNQHFNRPILVLKKFNNKIFLGIPLTTKVKENRYYIKFDLHGIKQCAMISQLRLFDGKRLTHKMGRLPIGEFEIIRSAVKEII